MTEKITQSAVDFQGNARFHLGLTVTDLNASISFYSQVFGHQPTKIREGYAKFEVAEPSVNFTLNAGKEAVGRGTLSHMGIQLKDTGALESRRKVFEELGMIGKVEEQTSCCYALQDKFWLTDPDGNEVEFFVVLAKDAPAQTRDACCV